MVSWYPDALGYVVAVPLGVAALVAVRRATRPPAAVAPERHLAPWHAAAFLALAFLPVVLVLTAKTVTHAFHARYAIAAFPGVCVLLILGLARMSGYSPRFAAAIWVMLLACFGGMSYRYQTVLRTERSDLQDTARFLRDHGEGPVAVSHLTRFHRLSFYAPRRLAGRLVYLADPSAAVKYLGWDTVDRGLLALNEWFPLNVRWFHEWVSGQRSFLVLGPVSDWSWLPTAFARSDADVKLVGTSGENLLLSVKDVKLPPDSRLPGDPSGYPMLFSRMPAEGRPLCEQYFPAGSCPNMD